MHVTIAKQLRLFFYRVFTHSVSHSDKIVLMIMHDSPVRRAPVVSIGLLSVCTSAATHSGSNDSLNTIHRIS